MHSDDYIIKKVILYNKLLNEISEGILSKKDEIRENN